MDAFSAKRFVHLKITYKKIKMLLWQRLMRTILFANIYLIKKIKKDLSIQLGSFLLPILPVIL
ncbi:hypothetical protein C2I27_03385 [Priestia megaterium]|nr:hypothetical protein C2I27_03385 [Priestia megaterium]